MMNSAEQSLRFETRDEMLSLVPHNARIAEIGVFNGDFSAKLLDRCRPSELVLLDLWPDCEIMSGDVDGNHQRTFQGRELESAVRDRFRDQPNITILKGYSSRIREFPENHFDAIYVDADHGYHGVRQDLANAWHVLKNGGWLMGHDYEFNRSKTMLDIPFGVHAAVTDFCRDHQEQIHALGMDGCVSYAIQVHKTGRFRRPMISLRSIATELRNQARRVRRLLSG